MNFEFNATYVDLQDIPSYSTSITLEGQLLKLSFTWNERLDKRALYIKNSTDVCYLQNKVLFPNESLELNSNAVFDDLPYKVVLQKVGDIKKVGNFLNWSKDFILCFYRTVDEKEQKLIVRYGVTEPSTPVLPKPYGGWILNHGYEIIGNDIKYTAYKTNSLDYYDSFALADLEQAVTSSLHDSDMQQRQTVKDAIYVLEPNYLNFEIDSINEVFKIVNSPESINVDDVANVTMERYQINPLGFVGADFLTNFIVSKGWNQDSLGKVTIPPAHIEPPYYFVNQYNRTQTNLTLSQVCQAYIDYNAIASGWKNTSYTISNPSPTDFYITVTGTTDRFGPFTQSNHQLEVYSYTTDDLNAPVEVSLLELKTALKDALVSNSTTLQTASDFAYTYDPSGGNWLYESTLATRTFLEVAVQIISNIQSTNQAISLLAETYVEAVANSIFSTDESKQFVKISDLISQFEENKILRV